MKEWFRGPRRAAIFVVLGLVVGSFLVTPAGAHVGGTVAHMWKDHFLPLAKKTFYTKKQVNQRLARATGRANDWPASGVPSIPPTTPTKVLEQALKAPKAGAYLLNYAVWVEGSNTIALTWLEMDQATPCSTDFSGAGHVPGTESASTLGTSSTDMTNAGTAVVKASKGAHKLTLCAQSLSGSAGFLIGDASVTALFVNSGSHTSVPPGSTFVPGSGALARP